MAKIDNIKQALNKAALLLVQPEYQTANELDNIARIFLVQGLIIELEQAYGLTHVQIGACLNVTERTIRAWLNPKQCPTLEHTTALVNFYLEIWRDYGTTGKG